MSGFILTLTINMVIFFGGYSLGRSYVDVKTIKDLKKLKEISNDVLMNTHQMFLNNCDLLEKLDWALGHLSKKNLELFKKEFPLEKTDGVDERTGV